MRHSMKNATVKTQKRVYSPYTCSIFSITSSRITPCVLNPPAARANSPHAAVNTHVSETFNKLRKRIDEPKEVYGQNSLNEYTKRWHFP